MGLGAWLYLDGAARHHTGTNHSNTRTAISMMRITPMAMLTNLTATSIPIRHYIIATPTIRTFIIGTGISQTFFCGCAGARRQTSSIFEDELHPLGSIGSVREQLTEGVPQHAKTRIEKDSGNQRPDENIGPSRSVAATPRAEKTPRLAMTSLREQTHVERILISPVRELAA